MKFENLIQSIQQTHTAMQQYANKAINRGLTIRNWLTGFYIAEFEQKGEDRAAYGTKLIPTLAKRLNNKSLSEGNLKVYRQFYNTYPQIRQAITDQLKDIGFAPSPIRQLLIGEFQATGNHSLEIGQSPIAQLENALQVPPDKLITKLSYTHLVQLFPINEPLKRVFYEIECIKGGWSVAELKRQINSLYFERSGLSKNPGRLSAMLAEKAETLQPADIIKSVYTFEFLGLHAKDVVEESDLETALLDNLQDFMLELGHGFCLEARQKRILIGDEYFFIDLVFYHRLLKCHILVDLKIEEFTHANAGQLNTYLNYYKAEVQQPDDNPPAGILLVTDKNKTLVEYATADMDKHLFVSKYLVELPSKEQLENFVQNELKQL
jgi:predicted nuclease of restriction endonuclease-like (RecB) superfamily